MKSSEKMSFSKALAISASQCSFGSNVGLCSFLFQRRDVTACTVTPGLNPKKDKRAVVVVCVESELVSKNWLYIAFTWMALLCNTKLAHKHTVCVPACPLVMSGRKKFPTEYLGSLWFFLHNGWLRAFWEKFFIDWFESLKSVFLRYGDGKMVF